MGLGMGQVTKGQVLDSNILIYHINGQLSASMEEAIFCSFEKTVYISVITTMELLSWPGHSEETIAATSALLEALNEIPLDRAIKDAAIEIRRQYRLKLPDAIIAATAFHLELPLLTRNLKDFDKIPELTVIDPF